ncbi:MAG: Organic hydroperoxide resistance transcriptional regulator [Firmicutes bacterium ADurb.Bin153]|nr:MAG: Organic hydroperoxide resistance transcriptional regulator [Firmicutes bacterium ADurb.Bin153]
MKEIKSLGMLMGHVIRTRHNRMTQLLEGLGIHPSQAQMLFLLIHDEGITQKQIGEKTNLRPATVTVMLNRMEKAGFVERRQDEKDLRSFRIYITEKGRTMDKAIKMTMEQLQKEAYAGFTDEELALMRRLLLHMKSNLEKSIKEESEKIRH